MRIIVANDDGIEAKGIRELTKALAGIADVYVAAPDVQRSGAGHGTCAHEKIYVEEVDFPGAKEAVSLTGTPADCMKIGIDYFRQKGIEFDMAVTGINHGGNLGTDAHYSGTISAAIEANFCGLPAVAVSVNSHEAKHFDYACDLAVRTVEKVYNKIDEETTISINVPNIPAEQVKGVAFASLGRRVYDWLKYCGEEDGKHVFRYIGEPGIDMSSGEDTDVMCIAEGYATITALKHDFTNHELTEELKKWGISS